MTPAKPKPPSAVPREVWCVTLSGYAWKVCHNEETARGYAGTFDEVVKYVLAPSRKPRKRKAGKR